MRNLLYVALVALVAASAYVGTADACHKHGKHASCGAPACGAPAPAPMGCKTCGAPAHHMGGCASGTCVASEETQAATLVVSLPADARLLIDGNVTTSETARRVFETPALESGREFNYTLEAQVVRDGKTEVITQRVTVRAGEATEVHMEMPTTVAAR